MSSLCPPLWRQHTPPVVKSDQLHDVVRQSNGRIRQPLADDPVGAVARQRGRPGRLQHRPHQFARAHVKGRLPRAAHGVHVGPPGDQRRNEFLDVPPGERVGQGYGHVEGPLPGRVGQVDGLVGPPLQQGLHQELEGVELVVDLLLLLLHHGEVGEGQVEEGHPLGRVQEPPHKLPPAGLAARAAQGPLLPHLLGDLGVVVQPGGKHVQEDLEDHLRLHKQPVLRALLQVVQDLQLVEAKAYVPAKVGAVSVVDHVPYAAGVLGQVLLQVPLQPLRVPVPRVLDLHLAHLDLHLHGAEPHLLGLPVEAVVAEGDPPPYEEVDEPLVAEPHAALPDDEGLVVSLVLGKVGVACL